MSVLSVNDQNFDEQVLQSSLPVLVDFAAEWCGPCKMMGPIIDEVAQELDGKIDVAKIDVDQAQSLAGKYNVMSIPNLIIFKNGKVAEQMTGAMAKDQLLAKINPHL